MYRRPTTDETKQAGEKSTRWFLGKNRPKFRHLPINRRSRENISSCWHFSSEILEIFCQISPKKNVASSNTGHLQHGLSCKSKLKMPYFLLVVEGTQSRNKIFNLHLGASSTILNILHHNMYIYIQSYHIKNIKKIF